MGKVPGRPCPPFVYPAPSAARSDGLGTCPDIANPSSPAPGRARPGSRAPPRRPMHPSPETTSPRPGRKPDGLGPATPAAAAGGERKPVSASSRPGQGRPTNEECQCNPHPLLRSSPASGGRFSTRPFRIALGSLLPFHVTRPNKQHGQHERGGGGLGGKEQRETGQRQQVRRAASTVAGAPARASLSFLRPKLPDQSPLVSCPGNVGIRDECCRMVADHFERIQGSFCFVNDVFLLRWVGGVTKGARYFLLFSRLVLARRGGLFTVKSTEPMRAGETRRVTGQEDEPNSSLPCVVHLS